MPTITVDTPAGSATAPARPSSSDAVVLVADPELFRAAALVLAAYIDGRKPRHDQTRRGCGPWCAACWLAVFLQQLGLENPQRALLTTTLPPRPDLD